jgi:hypothetical protein
LTTDTRTAATITGITTTGWTVGAVTEAEAAVAVKEAAEEALI